MAQGCQKRGRCSDDRGARLIGEGRNGEPVIRLVLPAALRKPARLFGSWFIRRAVATGTLPRGGRPVLTAMTAAVATTTVAATMTRPAEEPVTAEAAAETAKSVSAAVSN